MKPKIYLIFFFLILGMSLLKAQCGFIPGQGCSNTDYNNGFVNSNNNAATIEYDNYTSAHHGNASKEVVTTN